MAISRIPRRDFIRLAGGVVAGSLGGVYAMAGEEPDLVFIGAGINSLGATLTLAKAGWKVLVLDRNEVPGGAVRTLELTLPGFRHDIGAMNLSLLAGSSFFAEHRDALAGKGLDLVVADQAYGSLAHDGRFLGIGTDMDANLEAISRFSGADAEAWKAWRADFDRCSPVLFDIFGSPAAESGPLQLAFGRNADVAPEVAQVLRGILLDSLRANLTRRFETDAVQALVAAWAMHLDYAPDISGGCWMPFIETNVDERNGIPIARGGSGHMIEAIVALIGEAGGEVVSGVTVDEILVERGRVAGVRLEGGRKITSRLGVVASVTPQALVKLTRGRLPEVVRTMAERFRYGPGTLVIHLALSELPRWNDEAARRSFYVHLGPSLDYIAAAYQQCMAGLLPAEPFCVVAQPTLYDPSRAPPGKHVLWIMVRGVPAEIHGDAAGVIDGTVWTPDTAARLADRVIRQLSRHAPGLADSILGMAVHSPADLEALNPNLVGGDLNAGSLHLSQFYGNRPFAGHADHEMPVDGLYVCGASTWPGGGASPGSGLLLARKLLAQA